MQCSLLTESFFTESVGPGTDSVQVEVLREGIKAGRDTSVCLLNYRADGTPFFNQVQYAISTCTATCTSSSILSELEHLAV